MGTHVRFRLPPGRQPYDALNGFRIGALVGGLLGIAGTAVTNSSSVWLVLFGAVLGGAVGYVTETHSHD